MSDEDFEEAVWTPTDSLIGIWILDQFQILKLIHRGGMGRVYLAEQPSMARRAVIKMLRGTGPPSPESRRRFRREARAVSRLTHPNIVTVFNFGELADGSLFLAMEYVGGQNLDALRRRGPVPPMRAVNLIYQCASALGYAHAEQIVHRDLKPENIMLSKVLARDHIKLLDFGIARLLEEASSTQPGEIMGTPQYLSPEQCEGESATPASDQYALGLVFHELLTGEPALSAHSTLGFLHLHRHVTPSPPSKIQSDPRLELLDPVVSRMIAKSPTDRYASMAEVQEQLEIIANALMPSSKKDPSSAYPVIKGQAETAALTEGNPSQRAKSTIPAEASPTTHDGAKPPPQSMVSARTDTETARVVLLNETATIERNAWRILQTGGVYQGRKNLTIADISREGQREDRYILGLAHQGCSGTWRDWKSAGLPPDKTLLSVDAPVEAIGGFRDIAGNASHLTIGAHPIDPLVAKISLGWMRKNEGSIEQLMPGRVVQLLQINSSRHKAAYIESLLEDLRGEGVARAVEWAVREIGEEMIMNALFDAPVDKAGRHKFADSDRSSTVDLSAGEEATLRWVAGDRYIALSARDPFGSLTPLNIVESIAGSSEKSQSKGAGLGLRIMARAATHLIFCIAPGCWSEVLALIERDPTALRRRRSLTILQGRANQVQIGSRLWLDETVRPWGAHLRLRGSIDESSDLSPIFGRTGIVTLDLSGVSSINSMGIHAWIEAANQKADLDISFEQCAPAIVRQFTLLPGFSETGRIISVLAPYHCGTCSKQTMELLTLWEIKDREAPSRDCPDCGNSLDFEELADEYFAFLFM